MTTQNEERAARRRSSMEGTHRARGPRTAAQQREAAERRSRSISAGEPERAAGEEQKRSAAEGTERERRPAKPVPQERAGSANGKTHSGAGSANGGGRKKDGSGIGPLIAGIAVLAAACIVLVLVLNFSKRGTDASNETSGEAQTEETGPVFAENAIRMPASLDVSVLTGGPGAASEASSEEASQADGDEASESENASEGKATPVIELQGLTPEEVKEQVSKLYSWSMQIVNDKANVGATVKPTVDANETTEAATLGDAENPDSSPEEGLAEDAAQQEITVTSEIAVPDFVAQKLDELLSQIISDSESYAEHADASGKSESETADETSDAIETAAEAEGKAEANNGTETAAEAETVYKLELNGLEEAAQKAAAEAATMWYQMPKGGSIGSYDKSSGQFVMEGAKSGFEVDQAALASSILDKVAAGAFDARIEVPGNSLSAEEATAASEYKIIGTYTTKTTANSVRNKNIQLAAEAINGTILKPGEEFSFNNVVGQRTEAKGYGAAAAYNEGEVVQEVGGGICQVSTTLYNAVLRAGLKTTKRQSHTFEPSYVTPGRDATVSWGGPDYRFANVPSKAEYSNEGSYSIGIKAHYANREVTISIYGRPVLKDGYSFDLKSEKVKDIDVVRKPIEPGSDRTPTHGTKGSQWVTNLVVKKGGEVVSDKLDHNTYYSGHIEYYTEGGAAQTNAAATTPAQTAETETTPALTDATLPTETMPAETTTAAPQYETGVNGGPGVIISGGGQTSASGPGEVGPGVSQTEAANPQPTEAPQPPATQAQTPAATPAPQPEPTAAPQTPAPEISDGPVSDAPPAL